VRRLLLSRLPRAAGGALCASLALCAGLALTLAHAQDLSDASGFTVAGTVLNAATGQPIARAEVILNNDRAQLTGGDGSFSFDRVSAGTAALAIHKPGYSGLGRPGGGFHRMGSNGLIEGPPRLILVGPEMPSLTFRLTPLAALSGHLILSTADPADEIRIQVFRRDLENGRYRWTLADIEKTRSDGSWRAAGLPAGRYRVEASASIDGANDPENSDVPVWGFPALYYPGTTDVGSAGVLILKAGQQAQADMTLVRQRFFPVTIAVHGMPDTPTSFEIADTGGRSTGLPVHFDFRSGIAHANVPHGSWTLTARAFGATMRFGRTDFQVAGAPVSVAITVAPIPAIPVVIQRDFTASSDGSPRFLNGPGMSLVLAAADDFAAGGGITPLQPQPGGESPGYEIRIFQPGNFWVETQNFSPTYVASVTSGGTDLATTALTVAPGSQPAPIEVTLRDDAGTITGKVDSSSPGGGQGPGEEPRVWVYAIPLFPTTGEVPEAQLQNNVQFSLLNLPPGSWRVVACDAPQEIDFHTQEGLAAWSGLGQVVTVDPGGAANVELTVIHGEVSE
jgi:hypothetical protein